MQTDRIKILLHYVLPAILTNACVFLFTIVDGIFVGRGVGQDALGAVNIAMPFVMLATALNLLTSIGGVTVSAIRLGRGDKGGANQAFLHSLTANALVSVLVMLLGMVFTTPLCRLLGAEEMYLPMVEEYVFWWALFAIPSALAVNFQSFCRNDGSPVLVAVATVVSTLLNIFLDWLLVFPLQMGIMGAAVATGISQTVSWLIVLAHFVLRRGELCLCRYKPEGKLFRKIVFRGLPEMLAQFAMPVTTICLNRVLMATLADEGINTFAVISYVASFSMSVLAGTSEGLQPLFGQAYGAKREDDLKWYLRGGAVISALGSTLCVVLAVTLARPIGALFGAEENILDATAKYMPCYAWAFIVSGFNMLLSAYFYSTKRSVQAIVLNTARSFVVNIAVILGLSALFGARIVWYTFGISELLVLALAVALVRHSERGGIAYR